MLKARPEAPEPQQKTERLVALEDHPYHFSAQESQGHLLCFEGAIREPTP